MRSDVELNTYVKSIPTIFVDSDSCLVVEGIVEIATKLSVNFRIAASFNLHVKDSLHNQPENMWIQVRCGCKPFPSVNQARFMTGLTKILSKFAGI